MTDPKPDVANPPSDPIKPKVGDGVWYHPPQYHARHVPGPWAAIVLKVDPQGAVVLAVMPPTPTPVGTDPVARVEAVLFSATGEAGTWSWPAEGRP